MTEHYPFTGSWSRILLLMTQSEKAEPSRKPETSPVKSSKCELLCQAARQEPERSANARGFAPTGRGQNGRPMMTTQSTGEVRLSQGKAGSPAGSPAGSRREAAVSREPATPSPRHRLGPSLGPGPGAGHAGLRAASSHSRPRALSVPFRLVHLALSLLT